VGGPTGISDAARWDTVSRDLGLVAWAVPGEEPSGRPGKVGLGIPGVSLDVLQRESESLLLEALSRGT
jgi:hypothetical protein